MEDGYQKADHANLPKVTDSAVFKFISDTVQAETRGVKASRSSRDDYGDEAIGYVQVKHDGNICSVKARIVPEHKIRKTPYHVQTVVTQDADGEITILSSKCLNCAASLGGCKHATALVMWLYRRSNELSCTSQKAYWKKPMLACVGETTREIADLKTAKKKKKIAETAELQVSSGDFFNSFLERCYTKNHKCQISKHFFPMHITQKLSMHHLVYQFKTSGGLKNVNDFLSYCKQFYTEQNLAQIKTSTVKQSEQSYFFYIKFGRWSASTAHETSRCETPAGSLVEKILGGTHILTTAMKRGLNLEDDVIAAVSRKQKMKIRKTGCLLSGELIDAEGAPDGESDEAVFEIKSPSKASTVSNYLTEAGLPTTKVYTQIQLQMFLSGKKIGFLCVASDQFEKDKTVKVVKVDYDKSFIEEVIQKASLFWKTNVFPILYG